ncbi:MULTISPECIES: hypothetical protein [unclassified Crossiella]|uniref:hypothetical protein n=1 Tax=unclassified Crossiella TaxID=2620835 RepID=UPI001FFE4766|nr:MULTISPECIES: hypothetical protein [unclassified Crossiella]MCK2245213.1 hypothetical protein [Crossiella sp. S99.2]MCK2258865.1 hypothetical protein [Crossiella sp. S99.1]
MSDSVGRFEISREQRELLWTAISTVRDASPRQEDDADTEDIIDATVPVIGMVVAQEVLTRGAAVDEAWHEAGTEARHAWEQFSRACTPVDTADAIVALSNAMAALATFLPGYDYRTGSIIEPDDEPDAQPR